MAIVTVAPNYPATAARLGLEGYVIVEFGVSANGSVGHVQVIESSHSLFELPAVDAARKFRFRPRIVAGNAVPATEIRRKITFTLQD